MRPKTKDLEISGTAYRLGKLDAMTGVWIRDLLVAATLTKQQEAPDSKVPDRPPVAEENPFGRLDPEERGNQIVAMMWITAGASLEEAVYRRVQVCCLRTVSYLAAGSTVAQPVIMVDGRFTLPALEDDLTAVSRLILEALQFNLSPLFTGDAFSLQPKAPAGQPPSASK